MRPQGFTLVEIIISLAVIALLGGLAFPFYGDFQKKTQLQTVTTEIISTMKHAQENTINRKESTQWGIYFATNSYVFFKGQSYSARDTTFDEVNTLPSYISLSGLSEIVFDTQGKPNTTGILNIVISADLQQTLFINELGIINRG